MQKSPLLQEQTHRLRAALLQQQADFRLGISVGITVVVGEDTNNGR